MDFQYWKYFLWWLFTSVKQTRGAENFDSPRHYILNLTQTTFNDARSICHDNGGYLATVYDYSTIPDLQLQDFLISTDEALVWIGITTGENGTRSWDNGEGITFENWEPVSQPEIDCTAATFREPYTWTNQKCSLQLPFLCQYTGGQCRFDIYKNASIAAHNYMYLYEKTAGECQEVCLTSSVFICQSFEYDPKGRRCQFNSGNRWTLSLYYSSHQDWDYYHRTCNSGEVTGALLDISPPSTSSIPVIVSSTTSISSASSISPTPTFTSETSTVAIHCSEIFVTKDISITHDVYQTNTVTVTNDVFVTREIPVTRTVDVTNDITLSTTITETAFVTITATAFVTVTPSPVFFFPSESIYKDPVEELKELETVIKEKAKSLTKISVMDDRPSATYVGYFAILFLSCVFGSIVLFDMLTLFQSGLCQKCIKMCKGKKGKLAPSERKATYRHKDTAISSIASYDFGKDNTEDNELPSTSDARLWRKSLWAFGDSGFGGSEVTNSDTGSYASSGRDTGGVVTVEVQDTSYTRHTSSPGSANITTTTPTAEENLVAITDGNIENDFYNDCKIENDFNRRSAFACASLEENPIANTNDDKLGNEDSKGSPDFASRTVTPEELHTVTNDRKLGDDITSNRDDIEYDELNADTFSSKVDTDIERETYF